MVRVARDTPYNDTILSLNRPTELEPDYGMTEAEHQYANTVNDIFDKSNAQTAAATEAALAVKAAFEKLQLEQAPSLFSDSKEDSASETTTDPSPPKDPEYAAFMTTVLTPLSSLPEEDIPLPPSGFGASLYVPEQESHESSATFTTSMALESPSETSDTDSLTSNPFVFSLFSPQPQKESVQASSPEEATRKFVEQNAAKKGELPNLDRQVFTQDTLQGVMKFLAPNGAATNPQKLEKMIELLPDGTVSQAAALFIQDNFDLFFDQPRCPCDASPFSELPQGPDGKPGISVFDLKAPQVFEDPDNKGTFSRDAEHYVFKLLHRGPAELFKRARDYGKP